MKLNQFALYRVDQNTDGKVLWHLPYQEASRQNVPIRVEYYRKMSIQAMQENEKVTDVWKRIKVMCWFSIKMEKSVAIIWMRNILNILQDLSA